MPAGEGCRGRGTPATSLPRLAGMMRRMDITRRTTLLACLALAAPGAFAQGGARPAGAWIVEAIGGTPLAGGPRADITFTAEGGVHGTTGCNRFMGGFTLDGASLRFGPTAGTRMACPPPAMEQERRFHEALEAVRGWQAEGDALLLTDGTGATVLRLLRGPAG